MGPCSSIGSGMRILEQSPPSPHEKALTLARSQSLRPHLSMVPVRRGVPPSILSGPGEQNPATPLKPSGIRGIQ